QVEVILAGARRIEGGRLGISLDRVVRLPGFAIGITKIVVVAGDLLVRVGIFAAVLHFSLLGVDCLLICVDRRSVALGFFRGIGLLGSGYAIRVAQSRPQHI